MLRLEAVNVNLLYHYTIANDIVMKRCHIKLRGGGGLAFFRVIISFGLGPPEVAPYITGTFGEVFGPRNQTGTTAILAVI